MNIQFDTQIKLKQCTSLFGGVFLDNTTKWGNLAHSFDKASILNEEGCVRLFTYLQNLPRWLPRLKNFIIEPIIRYTALTVNMICRKPLVSKEKPWGFIRYSSIVFPEQENRNKFSLTTPGLLSCYNCSAMLILNGWE